ncbi:glycosyltransferase family 2 protein [Echinicola strongylocentroti]|uniref:Glycosyltransferase family 2 protein n=1 Tax=Echinicola strongylocentroti TaxID=1795355 RepID=A0A2Z4IMB1_9BACT|nr:glycosyltransferase family 2 protein [Echinicola strongylocentroti]AWW32252.1 glycosyltransferase family 2 protein [Echinicola strongylocentroti]
MPEKRSISVIIPNYNGKHLLEKYLPATLEATEQAGVSVEVIVVDDASTDGSAAFIAHHFPSVQVLVNSENKGFSYTCNQGIKAAQYDLVMLLNSDVALEKDYFDRLWKYFDQSDTFGVMGQIINSQGKTEDAARMMAFQGMKFKATHFYYSKDPEKWLSTAYLSGANALIDRKKLLELGGFDEIYSPFYVEDVDLSFRAWRMGWKCYYDHQSICHHEVSSTTKKHHTKKKLYPFLYRNKFILQAIHLDGMDLWKWRFQLILVEIMPRVLLGKWWIIKAYLAYWKKQPEIAHSKTKLKKLMQKHQGQKSLFDIKKEVFDTVKS